MTPKEARIDEKWRSIKQKKNEKSGKAKYEIGTHVRIRSYKPLFSKGHKQNWTDEIFTISQVRQTSPVTYRIIDENGEPVEGIFYEHELHKTKAT